MHAHKISPQHFLPQIKSRSRDLLLRVKQKAIKVLCPQHSVNWPDYEGSKVLP